MPSQSMVKFVHNHHISAASCEHIAKNPLMEGDDWSRTADHWKLIMMTLPKGASGKRRTMTTYFSKGSGHHGKEPTITEVLSAMSLDSSGYENARSFEDWAGDYGYDTDSRKAHRIYAAVGKQAKALKKFLGEAAYQELLYNTESD